MDFIFNLPIANEQKKDINDRIEEIKLLSEEINKKWEDLPESKKEELINYYYDVIESKINPLKKIFIAFYLFYFVIRYGIQPLFMLANTTLELLNTISDKIEQDNPQYQEDLKNSLSQSKENFKRINNIDEYIRNLASEHKQ